jgi:hypothetical protein
MILLCTGLLGAMSPAKAQTAPVTVPAVSQIAADDANLALKKDLDQRYEVLLQRFNKWSADATAFNNNYGGKNLDADTQEAKDGVAEQSRLSQALQDYQRDADQFKVDVDKFTELQKLADETAQILQQAKDESAKPSAAAYTDTNSTAAPQ